MVATIEQAGQMMTRGEVARVLGISGERVTQLARSGALPSVKLPIGRLYDRQSVERLAIERQARRTAA